LLKVEANLLDFCSNSCCNKSL